MNDRANKAKETEEKSERRPISDLGIAAYLCMHGFRCVGRKGKNFYFQVMEKDVDEFDKLSFEYLSSAFHDFDSHLMSLKKTSEYLPD